MKRSKRALSKKEGHGSETWNLSLYVLNKTAKSSRALDNLRGICEKYLPGRYRLEVIDLAINPELAKKDQIVALPTLVKRSPRPIRRLIGDFSETERVLAGLDVCP